jgi:hypothetical protein
MRSLNKLLGLYAIDRLPCRLPRKLITANIPLIARVSLHPLERHRMNLKQGIEYCPQIEVGLSFPFSRRALDDK